MHKVFETLFTLLEGDKESVIEIATDCYTQLLNDFPKISSAINSGELTTAQKLAHKLKGSVMNFQMPEMTSRFKELEHTIGESNLEKAYALCKELEQDIALFKTYIDEL